MAASAGRSLATAFSVHAALVGTWAGRMPAIKHALHLSDTRLGVALFGMAAGTLLGSWWGGHLAPRLGPAMVVRVVCFGTVGAIVDVGMNSLAVAAERDRRRPQMSGLHELRHRGRHGRRRIGPRLAQIPEDPLPHPPGRRAGRTPWSAGLVALGLVAFCSFFAEGTAADWSAVYMHDRAGAAPPWRRPSRASRSRWPRCGWRVIA